MEENSESEIPKAPETPLTADVPAPRPAGRWALAALRIFIAARMIGAGLSKFAASGTVYDENGVPSVVRCYSFENYQGVPADFAEKLLSDPLFPPALVEYFSLSLGPSLAGMGLCVLLGVKLKWALMILALFLAGMTFGLVLISPDAQPPAFDLLAVAFALYLTEKIEKEKKSL